MKLGKIKDLHKNHLKCFKLQNYKLQSNKTWIERQNGKEIWIFKFYVQFLSKIKVSQIIAALKAWASNQLNNEFNACTDCLQRK